MSATRPTLVLRHTVSGQTWTLTVGRMVIGRKDALAQAILEPDEVAVPLEDQLVSRRHAIIRADGGQFTVSDSSSRDGTYLNEKEITSTTAIAEGDRLRFGDTVLVASLERSAPLTASEPSSEADADRTVFQAPLLTRRPPELARPVVTRPPEVPSSPGTRPPDTPQPIVPRAPESPTPARPAGPAGPQTHPRVGPVPITPAPIGPPTPLRTPRPVIPVSEPPTPPVLPSQPTAAAPLPPVQPALVGPDAPPAGVSLADLTRASSELSASLRRLERDLSAVVETFERAGGRPALLAFVAQARRVEANPASAEDLENLIRWLPTACRMLETELLLVNLLSAQSSPAPR